MTFFERLKLAAAQDWKLYTEHPFTAAMADGSLRRQAFQHYLGQDYLFLIEFARAYALAVYKSPGLEDMRRAAAGLAAILEVEMNLHVKLCASWGMSRSELESLPAAPETLAYTRYVLDTGMRGDLLALQVALAPCVLGYAEIGLRLNKISPTLDNGNPYHVWIGEYSGQAYQSVADAAREQMESLAERYSNPLREQELARVFLEATRLETGFWDMAWRLQETA